MHGWVECVPNFSEGQDEKLILDLEAAVRAVPGVVFLRSDPNPDQNRTLFSFAGPGSSVRRAAFHLIREAMQRIDLTHHIGTHPRMGAVDVVPFIPLGTTTMEAASELARDLGEEVGRKLGLPIFLYEESATGPERRSLASLRKGGFEGHLSDGFPAGPPDFGPPKPHPTAGSVAVGARFFIIAFNLILDTNDMDVARSVSRAVRESTRGLTAVRALALPLASQGVVQVAVNILDFRVTSITKVLERAREEARRLGTVILQSELIGLVPRAALADSVWDLLHLPPQRRERVIEDAVENSSVMSFAERLAAATPTPGGGAAAARAGLHAASLVRMVSGIALERLKDGSHEEAAKALTDIRQEAEGLAGKFRDLEIRDQAAFDGYLAARRKARESATAGPEAAGSIAATARVAAEVPLELQGRAGDVLRLVGKLMEAQGTWKFPLSAGSDLGAAVEIARSAFRTAELNVRVNLPQIEEAAAAQLRSKCAALMKDLEARADILRAECANRFTKTGF